MTAPNTPTGLTDQFEAVVSRLVNEELAELAAATSYEVSDNGVPTNVLRDGRYYTWMPAWDSPSHWASSITGMQAIEVFGEARRRLMDHFGATQATAAVSDELRDLAAELGVWEFDADTLDADTPDADTPNEPAATERDEPGLRTADEPVATEVWEFDLDAMLPVVADAATVVTDPEVWEFELDAAAPAPLAATPRTLVDDDQPAPTARDFLTAAALISKHLPTEPRAFKMPEPATTTASVRDQALAELAALAGVG